MGKRDYIDTIYVQLLSKLCGESSYDVNSRNLLFAESLHRNYDFSWKTIYFGLLEYSTWLEKQWDEKHDKTDDDYFRGHFSRNRMDYDTSGRKCLEIIRQVAAKENQYMTAEEFRYINSRICL